tara:strand:- start:351 stop:1280 length:930 start_codon:yes stop_codon:yes gene_type:complete
MFLRMLTLLLLFGLFHSVTHADLQVTKIAEVDGFQIPECVVVDTKNQTAYVSNVNAAVEGEGYDRFWADDGNGFISKFLVPRSSPSVRRRGKVANPSSEKLHGEDLVRSDEKFRFSGPKGMCLLGDELWVTDIDRVLIFSISGKAEPQIIHVPGAVALNDMASDGEFAYVTDSAAGTCYRLHKKGKHQEIAAPKGINGITFHNEKMYGVSWGLSDIYELDPDGKKPPRSFMLSEYFKTPDGIEVLADGTFIVSDSEGNQVVSIAPDEKTVTRIIECAAPADIGIDRSRGLLFVPRFFESKVDIYELENR